MPFSQKLKTLSLWGLAVSTMALAGCAGMTTGSNGTSSSMQGAGMGPVGNIDNASTPTDLTSVKSWSIRASDITGKAPSVEDLAADPAGLLIVAPADLQSKDHPLDKQVAAIRGKGPKRIILALIDAGHAGPSTGVWDPSWADTSGKLSATAPDWLVASGKSDAKQYRTQYWNAAWQKALGAEVDTLRKAGFDGVCLDGLDAASAVATERQTSAVDMAALVEGISHAARTHAANFYVVPLDNEGLVAKLADKDRGEFLKTVDAVVAVSVFYHGKNDGAELNPSADLITALDKYQYAHRPVFVADFVTGAEKVADFQERAKSRGYLPWTMPVVAASVAAPAGAPASIANGAQTSI